MADSLPATPTEGEFYNRGVEDYRNEKVERRELPNRGLTTTEEKTNKMSDSPTRRSRSRSPLRKQSRSPRRDNRRDDNRRDSNKGFRGGSRTIKDKSCRVYVSNLNFRTRWMVLKDEMKKIGNVEHVEVFTDGDGRSKGCAVVEFSNPEDAAQAIKELDGFELLGRKIRLREDIIDDEIYKEQLKTQGDKSKAFRQHQQKEQSNSTNFFGQPGMGALGGLGNLLGNQTAQSPLLAMLTTKGGDPNNSSVFVSNLDYDLTWQKLKDTFRRAGNCIRCDVAMGEDNHSKGFGSVVFETPMEALSAIAMFNKCEIGNSSRPLSVRLDRNSYLNQVLGQLGLTSSDQITQSTLVQIQSLATLSMLTGGGGLNLAGLSALGGFGALGAAAGGLGSLGSTGQSNQTNSQSSALNNFAGLGAFGGLGNLIGSTGLSGANALSSVGGSLGGSQFGMQMSGFGSGSQLSSSYSDRRNSDSGGGGRYSQPSSSVGSGTRVFVKNLPFAIKWQDLKDRFREAGNIVRADVMKNDDGRSKGCGTVTFETPLEAAKAVATFNGARLDGRDIEVRMDRY